MLPKAAVLQFQELYKSAYSITLDFKEAEKMANRTFSLLKLITKESNGLRKGELKKSPKIKNQTVC